MGNFAWLAGDKAVRLVLNTGVGFWLARHLGPQQFGQWSFSLAVIGMAALAAELGLDAVLRRELILDPARADVLLAAARRLRIGSGMLAAVGLWVSLLLGWVSPTETLLVAVLALTLAQPALFVPDAWLQARLEARRSVWAQDIALAVAAAARIACIVWNAPLVAFAWAAVGEMLLGGVLLARFARGAGMRFGRVERVLMRQLLSEAWPLALSGLTVILYMRVDVLMLRHFAGDDAVGIYSAATRFVEIWYFVPTALAASLLPGLARGQKPERWQRYYDLNAGLAYLIAVPTVLAAPWLVSLAYGSAYTKSSPVLMVMAWALLFVFLGVARGQALVLGGHTRFYLGATGTGLVLNVVLNLALIPSFGAWGAALATLVGQAMAAWISSFCFAPVRPTAWMQTRALFIPVRWFRYVRSS